MLYIYSNITCWIPNRSSLFICKGLTKNKIEKKKLINWTKTKYFQLDWIDIEVIYIDKMGRSLKKHYEEKGNILLSIPQWKKQSRKFYQLASTFTFAKQLFIELNQVIDKLRWTFTFYSHKWYHLNLLETTEINGTLNKKQNIPNDYNSSISSSILKYLFNWFLLSYCF